MVVDVNTTQVNGSSFWGALALVISLGAFAPGCAGGGTTVPCDPECLSAEECCEGTCMLIGMCGTPGVDSGPRPGVDSGPPPSDCAPECLDTQRCCGGVCIERSVPQGTDRRSDPSFANCNGCGLACLAERASSCSVPGGGTGTPRCLCGDFECIAGEACVLESGNWFCINTSTDPSNCGAIGNRCAQGESCVGGVCQCGSSGGSCTTGQACCAGACRDVSADPMNCGGCGVVCLVNAPNCNSGTCGCGTGPACRTPMPPSGSFPIPIPIPGAGGEGDPGELCCDGGCIDNTTTDCGMCGNMCASDETCGVSSGLFGMGATEVCCLEEGDFGSLLGCGGGGGFPFPGADGGGFGIDGGFP